MPTNAPPTSHVVQKGRKRCWHGLFESCWYWFIKRFSTQILTSLPTFLSATSTTMTSKPLTKGIIIGSSGGGSSSKPPILKEAKGDKGKGIETSTEENKKA